jgi:hypothetical protein
MGARMKKKLKTVPQLDRLADMPTRLDRLGRPHIRIKFDRLSDAANNEPPSSEATLDQSFQRIVTKGRGTELLHAVEKVRRLLGSGATIGVVVYAKDRATYDRLNFYDQREEIDTACGPFKIVDIGLCHVELGYHTKDNQIASMFTRPPKTAS